MTSLWTSDPRGHKCLHKQQFYPLFIFSDEIELFLRNCVRSGSPVTNDCRKEEFQAFRRDVCTCDSNLCNTAAGVAMSSVVPIRLVIISSLWCLPWFKYWLLWPHKGTYVIPCYSSGKLNLNSCATIARHIRMRVDSDRCRLYRQIYI